MGTLGNVVVGAEKPADLGLHEEQQEVLTGNRLRRDNLDALVVVDRREGIATYGNGLEDIGGVGADVAKVRVRKNVVLEVANARVDLHQLVRRFHWHAAENRGVDQAEDRRVGADADRQRNDGGGRETGALPHAAHGVSQIAQQGSGRHVPAANERIGTGSVSPGIAAPDEVGGNVIAAKRAQQLVDRATGSQPVLEVSDELACYICSASAFQLAGFEDGTNAVPYCARQR